MPVSQCHRVNLPQQALTLLFDSGWGLVDSSVSLFPHLLACMKWHRTPRVQFLSGVVKGQLALLWSFVSLLSKGILDIHNLSICNNACGLSGKIQLHDSCNGRILEHEVYCWKNSRQWLNPSQLIFCSHFRGAKTIFQAGTSQNLF